MWKPVVTDEELVSNIRHKIEDIFSIVHRHSYETARGLINGSAGALLFEFYYNQYNSSRNYSEKLSKKIIDLYAHLPAMPTGVLSSGVAGALWSLNHLNNEEFIELDQENFSEISESLSFSMLKHCEASNFDYLHGANGIAFYLLDRAESDPNYLNEWIRLLQRAGISEDNRIHWPSIIFPKEKLYGCSLGLAHGLPSTILVLIKFLKKQNHPVALDMLEKSLNYLMENRNTETTISYFPNYITADNQLSTSRLAWCYGDMGIAQALYEAGEFLQRPQLQSLALEMLSYHATKASEEQSRLNLDADFCHGTVGVAHIFSRFYNRTANPLYRQAAVYYYQKTLQMANHDGPCAGYLHHEDSGYKENYTYLEGIVGIGLSLISSITPTEPRWDQSLLLS